MVCKSQLEALYKREMKHQQTPPLLSVRNLQTVFPVDGGEVRAVDGVSFDVESGQTVAIVGESGCGKTVTARSILMLVDYPGRVVEGQILFRRDSEEPIDLAQLDPDGEEIRATRGKEIALIFQEPMASFSPVHTVGSQIAEAIRIHHGVKASEAREKTIEMMRKAGVPQPEIRLDDYPHQLSGGLLQRAMIAMALSGHPRILIADEPTTALDVTTQTQILVLLRELQERDQMSMIFITHDLGVVAHVADVVVVMYLGRVVEKGPVTEVFHSPQHPYTRALLRSIPPLRSKREGTLDVIDGTIPHPLSRPSGCPFHDRCRDFIAGKCDPDEPQSIEIADGHEVSCFLYES